MSDYTFQILALINFAFIDGKLNKKEIKWLRKRIQKTRFNDLNRFIIEKELKNPSGEPFNFFRQISRHELKSDTLKFAMKIIRIDKKLTKKELEEYQKALNLYERIDQKPKAKDLRIVRNESNERDPESEFIEEFFKLLEESIPSHLTPRAIVYILFGGGERTYQVLKKIFEVLGWIFVIAMIILGSVLDSL